MFILYVMQNIETPDYRKKPQSSLQKILDTNVKLGDIVWLLLCSVLALQTANFISHALQNKSKNSQYTIPDIPRTIWLHTHMATKSVVDLILKKWGLTQIPDSINYGSKSKNTYIDISPYKHLLTSDSLFLLKNIEGGRFETSVWVNEYCQKDYYKYKPLLQKISSEWIHIQENDSYRDKVGKIQKFIAWLDYDNDILYLGDSAKLSAASDYQLPVLANILIGNMDCNNKTWMFVELCRVNNIISGIGISWNHAAPAVFTDTKDEVWSYIDPNVSVDRASGWSLNGIVVDPTWSITTDIGQKPLLAGATDAASYKGMTFTIFWPK